jgi:hypothetical protein
MATQGPIPEIVDPMIDPRTGEYAVIAPGHTFKSVTQKIAGIVLTANTPWAWVGGLFLAATIATGVVIAVTWLVDRYRPRRNADLRNSAAVQADLA